jgi:hypothetical protein
MRDAVDRYLDEIRRTSTETLENARIEMRILDLCAERLRGAAIRDALVAEGFTLVAIQRAVQRLVGDGRLVKF